MTVEEKIELLIQAQEILDKTGGDYLITYFDDEGISSVRHAAGVSPHRLIGLVNITKIDLEMEALGVLHQARQNAAHMAQVAAEHAEEMAKRPKN